MPLRFAFVILLAACSSHPAETVDAPGGDTIPDAATSVTFRYAPAWSGVQSVEVIGGFGQAGDWTAPLLTLTPSGGVFVGTTTLPNGTYPYLFHVIGDADAGTKAATYARYAIDPTQAAYAACPAQAPTYSAMVANPCGQLTVPQTDATLLHVRGTVVFNAAPAASYIVLIEREEPSSHHFFANRITTAADGAYDFAVAAGKYRIQVQHPSYESKTDAQLAPSTALRRAISSAFSVAVDVTVSPAQVAFPDYAAFAPQATAALPTAFAFGNSRALPTHLEVYGTANAGVGPEIGDPWFSAAPTTTAGASFNGTFTTSHATQTAVALGERYFWGVEQTHPADSAGIVWVGQSMVYPVTWH